MTLGGCVCVRNGDELDYCWREAVASLLPVCDEVIICDSDSTDGTREAADRWADKEPKIRVVNYPWPGPRGDSKWWTTWLNFAREHLTTDLQISLDADEILSDELECRTFLEEWKENSGGVPLRVNRLNFWRDARHLIPDGHCCGKWVTRMGPAKYWIPSDEAHPAGELPILDQSIPAPSIEIFHLGFLRRTDAFWRKARVVLGAFFDTYDTRLEKLEAAQKPLSAVEDCEWTNSLVPWSGYMPDAAERWLSDRGHRTNHYVPMNEQEAYRRVKVVPPTDPQAPMKVLVVGDYGDILYGMAVFKAIGAVDLYARDANHLCKRIVHRMPELEPLLLSQGYVKGLHEHQDEEVHWNAGEFRTQHETTRSLAHAHLAHYRGQKNLPPITVNFAMPWITGIHPDSRSSGRIVINRTSRYQNPHFRWNAIVSHYGNALLFIGTQEEHSAFTRQFGEVEWQPTRDLLDAAEWICGSAMFIGNQSACYAIAEGMKHRRLLEVCLYQPDVLVSANQSNCYTSADGSLDIPAMAGKPTLKLAPSLNRVNYLKNPSIQPRTGWRYQDLKEVSYSTLKRQVMRRFMMDDQEAHRAIFDALAEREPGYFYDGTETTELTPFRKAMANIGAVA